MDTEQWATAIGGGVIVLITAFFTASKDIFRAYVDRKLRSINRPVIDLSSHPIHRILKSHVDTLDYRVFTVNQFKQAVIVDREKIIWSIALSCAAELAEKDVDKLTDSEFKLYIKQIVVKLHSSGDELRAAGMSDKTVNIMQAANYKTRQFVVNLVEAAIQDKIYDCNTQRVWVIFSIYAEYMQYAHTVSLDALISANGNLVGETYKGITNNGEV
jgi:hypothetical protein